MWKVEHAKGSNSTKGNNQQPPKSARLNENKFRPRFEIRGVTGGHCEKRADGNEALDEEKQIPEARKKPSNDPPAARKGKFGDFRRRERVRARGGRTGRTGRSTRALI